MKKYFKMNLIELKQELDLLLLDYDNFCKKNLNLDMSRGKPSSQQLDLSRDMIDILTQQNSSLVSDCGIDTRNYGGLDGLKKAREFFADIFDVDYENVLVAGNSSLNLMYDCLSRSMIFGVNGLTPWHKLNGIKFLCPSPGYDRHFAVTEHFNIEMITIPMRKDGPDMDMVKKFVESDENVKGIWCVPKYSNPTGITYSDDVVKAFANLNPKANDFRVYWDNAYSLHDINDNPEVLLNIIKECEKTKKEDMVLQFASTSKMTFSGAGISTIITSQKNLQYIKKSISIQTIGYDKINQLRHIKFFESNNLYEHMKKHAKIVKPKFDIVISSIKDNLEPLGIAEYTNPNGGYFISFNTLDGCATRVGELCKNAGLILTPVGATFPYGKDVKDSNIRIAPTFPPTSELKMAMDLFCCCVKIASIEKLLK